MSYKNITAWVSAIPRITQLLSGTSVNVSFSGDSAYTEFDNYNNSIKRINLPSLPSNVDKEGLALTMAYMFHEVSHVLHTDFKKIPTEDVNLKLIHNIVEDVYVDKKISKRFLEASKYLAKVKELMVSTFSNKEEESENDLVKKLCMLTAAIRYMGGDDVFKKMHDDCLDNYKDLEFIFDYKKQIQDLDSTQDCVDLAKIIYEKLKKEFEQNKDKSKEENEEDNQNQEDQDENEDEDEEQSSGGSGGSDGSDEEDDQDDEESKDNQDDEESKDNQDDKKSKGDKGKKNKESDGQSSPNGSSDSNLGEALQNAAKIMDNFKDIKQEGQLGCSENIPEEEKDGVCLKIQQLKQEKDGYSVNNRSNDEFTKIESDFSERDFQTYFRSEQNDKLKNKLYRFFMSKGKKSYLKAQKKGKLSANNLYRLACDDIRVFQQKVESQSVNTAVTLLIDCSGSMSGSKYESALKSAYMFGEALERINIPCEILGFSTGDKMSSGPGRRDSIVVPVFKSFAEKFNINIKGRFCSALLSPSKNKLLRNNADGDSIIMALSRLEKRSEERKMMFVLSDGMPNCYGCDGEEVAHLKSVVKDIEKRQDYEIYGIGIETDCVKEFYSNNCVLDNCEKLGIVLMNLLNKNIYKKG